MATIYNNYIFDHDIIKLELVKKAKYHWIIYKNYKDLFYGDGFDLVKDKVNKLTFSDAIMRRRYIDLLKIKFKVVYEKKNKKEVK